MSDEQAAKLAEAIADLARDIAWGVHFSDDTPAGGNDEAVLKARLAALLRELGQSEFSESKRKPHVGRIHQRADVAEACQICNPRVPK